MLTALVTVWAASLVVLAVLLSAVIVCQAVAGRVRRLGGSWRSRPQRAAPRPGTPLLAGRAGR